MARTSAKPAAQEAAKASAVKLRLVGSIGAMTDKLFDLRESKRELEEQIKTIETEYAEVEETLMKRLEAEGTDKAAGKSASVSITTSVVANVLDWDKFHAWIKKTGHFHLLQRRVSDAAWREIAEKAGTAPPGTQPFSKKRLNLRTTT